MLVALGLALSVTPEDDLQQASENGSEATPPHV